MVEAEHNALLPVLLQPCPQRLYAYVTPSAGNVAEEMYRTVSEGPWLHLVNL
jgi:hypothetical protein